MARGNKLSKPKGPLRKLPESLLQTIVEDAIKTASMSFDDWRASSPHPFFPLAIPASQGHEYRVTQTGISAAQELTEKTWMEREDFRQTIEREEFDRLSFAAIGDSIENGFAHPPEGGEDSESILSGDAFYVEMASKYADNLDRLAARVRPDVNQHIPCHLFHSDQKVPAFSIGPIEFRPRAEWLDCFVTDSGERAYIRQVDEGALSSDEFRQRAYAPGHARDINKAWSAFSSLRGFSWVATVRMTGHALERSHFKASTFVGLAIDALGLRFHLDDARRFTKAGRQHLYGEDRLATLLDGTLLHGMSRQMPGVGSRPGALAAKIAAERAFLDAVGTVLGAFVQGCRWGSKSA
jgi:hypothetical protein